MSSGVPENIVQWKKCLINDNYSRKQEQSGRTAVVWGHYSVQYLFYKLFSYRDIHETICW